MYKLEVINRYDGEVVHKEMFIEFGTFLQIAQFIELHIMHSKIQCEYRITFEK